MSVTIISCSIELLFAMIAFVAIRVELVPSLTTILLLVIPPYIRKHVRILKRFYMINGLATSSRIGAGLGGNSRTVTVAKAGWLYSCPSNTTTLIVDV